MRMQIVQERQQQESIFEAQQRGKGTGGRWDPMDFEWGMVQISATWCDFGSQTVQTDLR